MIQIEPKIVDPVELVQRVRGKLIEKRKVATTQSNFLVSNAYEDASTILIEELQAMIDETTARILEESKS